MPPNSNPDRLGTMETIAASWPHPIRSTDTDSAHELATSLGWHLAED